MNLHTISDQPTTEWYYFSMKTDYFINFAFMTSQSYNGVGLDGAHKNLERVAFVKQFKHIF